MAVVHWADMEIHRNRYRDIHRNNIETCTE